MRERFAASKYVVPPTPPCYVARPRLRDALDRGAALPLTSVVGPPGSGKTIAVSSWVASRRDRTTMWMSCDERDADPTTFWRGMITGLQRRRPDAWLDARDAVEEDAPELREVAVAFVNELAEVREPSTIVIDDFHLAKDAAASVAVAVDGLPTSTRLVLVGRTDPDLSIHRLRARQALAEVRGDELRLSAAETTALAGALGLALDGSASALLHERTEGWMAAVHLAGLSLRGRDDADAFLRTFSGENRLMAEFLLGEVLSSLPPHIERFLEDSSVLEELDPATCRAVTGVTDSAELLRALAADNMLIAPRGDGLTYRCHQLFRDLLQYRLRASSPERFVALHKLAAHWHENHGELARAAGHLTIAGDDRAAFTLLRDHAFELQATAGPTAVSRLVSALDLRRAVTAPSRAVDVAMALAMAGALEESTRWIARIDNNDGARLSAGEASRLAAARANLALLRGDPAAAEVALRGVAPIEGESDPILDHVVLLKSRALLWLDDPVGARQANEASSERGNLMLEVSDVTLTAALSQVASVEGGLTEAETLADAAIAAAERFDLLEHPSLSEALTARGRVLYERDQLQAAEGFLERAISLSEPTRAPFALLARVALARVLTVERRYSEAEASLELAQAGVTTLAASPLRDLVVVAEAQLALAMGDADRARHGSARLPLGDRRRRLEATIALAQNDAERALKLLAETDATTVRQRVDTAVLRARALDAVGAPDADDALAECLTLARPERFVTAIADGMRDLGPRISFRLRSGRIGAFEHAVLERLDRPRSRSALGADDGLVETLTAREYTVVRYLTSRLTVTEIASECHVSTNTLKTHLKAVYRKLGVSSRREAISAAQRLSLI